MIGGNQMKKTLKKLTLVLVVTLAVIGGILGTISATANAQGADEDAIKAEVLAAARQLGHALNTSDGELFDTLWLQSDETTYISVTQPFRIEGWPAVRQPFAGLLRLPAENVSHVLRQERVDMLGDDVALHSGYFIIKIRPPGAATITINGRVSAVLQKIDGKWLRVHTHTSALP
jgi:ketosteroid isomerase-like protein